MKFLQFVIVIPLVSISLLGCKKSKVCPGGHYGTIVDLTGLDGCGWAIELKNGDRLEPLNLDDFDVSIQEGRGVWFTYQAESRASICMVGETIRITCMVEK